MRNIRLTLNIPNIFLCHITVCYEIILKWNSFNFFTLFFKRISTTYPKNSRKYGAEHTFLRKLNLIVFGVQKLPNFWKMTAIFAISHNNSLWRYYRMNSSLLSYMTNCNVFIQHIQRRAQNINRKVLFKGKTNGSFFWNTLYME